MKCDEENKIKWTSTKDELPKFCTNYDYVNQIYLVTVNTCRPTTLCMTYQRTKVRGKTVERWEWNGRISPWEVIAWAEMPEPYKEREQNGK